MSEKALHVSLSARRGYGLLAWLSANRSKRGALLYWSALFTISAALIRFIGVLQQPPQSGILVALLLVGSCIQASIAISVVVLPARRPFIAAAGINGAGVLCWIMAHSSGLPVGPELWRAETLSWLDLYLPAMEIMATFFLLCLFGRTWQMRSRVARVALNILPALFIAGLMLCAVLNFNAAELFTVVFLLSAGLPNSLLDLFVPVVGLLALLLLLRAFIPRLRMHTPGAWRTALIVLPAFLIINIMLWSGATNAANAAWFTAAAPLHAPAGQTTTLAYCTFDGNPLAMDLSEPGIQATRPAPAVFFIHGGEGLQGNRQLTDADGRYFTQLRNDLVSRGFVVGSIDYTLVPFSRIAGEITQTRCAVRFLRAHASELGIDPLRIGVYGASEGGYLADMLGTTGGMHTSFDTGQYLEQSSRVQAVVDMWGFTDLSNWSGSPAWVSALGQGLGSGASASQARLKGMSPVSYVAHGDPPFLIMHGADDWFIAPHHSQDFAKLLQAAGVPATLVMIQHDGHGLTAATAGQVEQPSPDALIHMISDFFARTLAA